MNYEPSAHSLKMNKALREGTSNVALLVSHADRKYNRDAASVRGGPCSVAMTLDPATLIV